MGKKKKKDLDAQFDVFKAGMLERGLQTLAEPALLEQLFPMRRLQAGNHGAPAVGCDELRFERPLQPLQQADLFG